MFMCIWKIDGDEQVVQEDRQTKLFPEPDQKYRILSHALTTEFLYYGTDVSHSFAHI